MWSNWLQILPENIYDSVVHIHTVEFEVNWTYLYMQRKFLTPMLEVPENGIVKTWMFRGYKSTKNLKLTTMTAYELHM